MRHVEEGEHGQAGEGQRHLPQLHGARGAAWASAGAVREGRRGGARRAARPRAGLQLAAASGLPPLSPPRWPGSAALPAGLRGAARPACRHRPRLELSREGLGESLSFGGQVTASSSRTVPGGQICLCRQV